MKKTLLLSLLSLASMSPIWGQTQVVQVEQLSATYGASPTVTFRVYWTTPPDGSRHRSNVWLFVDYLLIENNAPVGDWTPAAITGVVSVSDGTPSYPVALPYRGFYLQGNPSGAFSSTVTVALDGLANTKFNWCVYATDYPPNATEAAGYYALHGAPPFTINNSTTESSKIYTGGCITTLTDVTGCPGIPPAQPAITAFEATPDTVCVGDTVTLMATAIGAASYSFDGGVSWQPEASLTVLPTKDTACSVLVKNSAGCTVTAAPIPVVVHPRPVPSFVNPPDTACAGSSIKLTATGGGSYCFTQECINCIRNPYESGNDEEGAAHCYILPTQCSYTPDSTYTLVMPESGSVTVWVRVINDNGCTDSISATIEVRAVPPAPVLSGSGTYCGNVDLHCFGETGYTYQLQEDLTQAVGAPLSGANALLDFPITTSGTYTVVVTDPVTGCVATSNAQAVTVEAAPSITLTSAATTTSQTVTGGNPTIIRIRYTTTNASGATVTGLPNGVSGSWTSNVYTINGTPNTSPSFGLFNYTVTTTNNNGCTNAAVSGTIAVANSCNLSQPPAVGTFAGFDPATYSDSTLVSLVDERDNKVYKVVKIGGRWIMAQNLNYQEGLTWQSSVNAGGRGSFWCPGGWSSTTATSSTRASCNVWGALYLWETAMMVDGKWTSSAQDNSAWTEPTNYGTSESSGNTQNHARSDAGDVVNGRGICPPNWHVPTDEEWGVLFNAMETGTQNHNTSTGDIGTNAGKHAKASCLCPNGPSQADRCISDTKVTWFYHANNASYDIYGFQVIPAGNRNNVMGYFADRGSGAYFWSSTASSSTYAWGRSLVYLYATVSRDDYGRILGFSVRCIRDL